MFRIWNIDAQDTNIITALSYLLFWVIAREFHFNLYYIQI